MTSLIHFYFTIINLIIFNTIKIYSFLNKQINLKEYLFGISKCHIPLIFLMFLVGYFEVRIVDTLALGFGNYKLNILSIFDSTISHNNISWSWIIPDIKLTNGEELEGFNFLGLGGIILVILGGYSALSQKKIKLLNNNLFNNGIYFAIIIMFLLSLSNNIAIGKVKILSIPLNDYLYGLFSIIRSSGRLFWIVSYFIIFLSIFFINIKYKKNSFLIFLIILIIQFFDISPALKNYITNDHNKNKTLQIKDEFWTKTEITKINHLITTNPVNYNKHFNKLAYYMEKNKIYKTNIVKMARIDREKAAKNKYVLIEKFNKKQLDENTIYIIDNIGHLISLQHIFKDDNVGFFFKDNIWIMIKNKKNLMDKKDKEILNNIIIDQPKFFYKKKLNYNENNNFAGFGWSHNFNKNGIWSEGKNSNLIFKLKKQDNIFFEMNIFPFLNEKNKEIEIEVFVNGNFNNKIYFKYNEKFKKEHRKVVFQIKKENIVKDVINIEFKNKNPKSPFELSLSPDSRQLNFLLLSFSFFSKSI